jgi:hypothetical protein
VFLTTNSTGNLQYQYHNNNIVELCFVYLTTPLFKQLKALCVWSEKRNTTFSFKINIMKLLLFALFYCGLIASSNALPCFPGAEGVSCVCVLVNFQFQQSCFINPNLLFLFFYKIETYNHSS